MLRSPSVGHFEGKVAVQWAVNIAHLRQYFWHKIPPLFMSPLNHSPGRTSCGHCLLASWSLCCIICCHSKLVPINKDSFQDWLSSIIGLVSTSRIRNCNHKAHMPVAIQALLSHSLYQWLLKLSCHLHAWQIDLQLNTPLLGPPIELWSIQHRTHILPPQLKYLGLHCSCPMPVPVIESM